MSRAEPSGIKLNAQDAAIIKGMLARGDRQHDIAAWFGVNGGRITEIHTRRKFRHVGPATSNLPPRGPYPCGRAGETTRVIIAETIEELHHLVRRVEQRLGEV